MAVQHDPAPRRCEEPKQREGNGRLAAAGFADQAEALTALQLEIDAVDRAQQPPAAAEQATPERKMHREILHAEDDVVVRLHRGFRHDGDT